jgi:hypothetical protein
LGLAAATEIADSMGTKSQDGSDEGNSGANDAEDAASCPSEPALVASEETTPAPSMAKSRGEAGTKYGAIEKWRSVLQNKRNKDKFIARVHLRSTKSSVLEQKDASIISHT